MAVVRPLAPSATNGVPTQIVAPDTIDPAILPASGSTPVTVSANYSVPANSQVFARWMKIDASHDVLIPADSELVFA